MAGKSDRGIRCPDGCYSRSQTGNHARALAPAEADIRLNRANDDIAASKAYERQERAKVTIYAKGLIEKLASLPMPEGTNPAEWARNRGLKQGLAQWMLGMMASTEQRWPDADIHLRAPMPNVGQNKAMSAEALYHLGVANFKLGEAKNDKRHDRGKFPGTGKAESGLDTKPVPPAVV